MTALIAMSFGALMFVDATHRLRRTIYRDRAMVLLELAGGVMAFGVGAALMMFGQ